MDEVLHPQDFYSLSAKTMVEVGEEYTHTAPKKHPTSYKAVTVPKSEVCSDPPKFKVSRKFGVTITPPMMKRLAKSWTAIVRFEQCTKHSLVISKQGHVSRTRDRLQRFQVSISQLGRVREIGNVVEEQCMVYTAWISLRTSKGV